LQRERRPAGTARSLSHLIAGSALSISLVCEEHVRRRTRWRTGRERDGGRPRWRAQLGSWTQRTCTCRSCRRRGCAFFVASKHTHVRRSAVAAVLDVEPDHTSRSWCKPAPRAQPRMTPWWMIGAIGAWVSAGQRCTATAAAGERLLASHHAARAPSPPPHLLLRRHGLHQLTVCSSFQDLYADCPRVFQHTALCGLAS